MMLLFYEHKFLFQVVLAGAFYPNYFTFGQPDEEMAVRELAGKDPKTTVVVGGAERPPPLGTAWATGVQMGLPSLWPTQSILLLHSCPFS